MVLAEIASLEVTEEALALADNMVQEGVIPESSAADALHIAIAVTSGCEYLVTWNYRHMANAVLRSRIEGFCRDHGYEPTVICIPEELVAEED